MSYSRHIRYTAPLANLTSHKWIMKLTGSLDRVYQHGPDIYTKHNQHIRDLIVDKRGYKALDTDLLEFNVKQGYQPLCDFVSLPSLRSLR